MQRTQPLLSKSAAIQFERMDKRAQVEILTSPETPPLVKLALAARHTKGLSKEARAKLVRHVYSKMAAHEKEAIGKLLMGAGKLLGQGFKAMKPGFGNSAALQGQMRALGGVQNVRNNLGVMGHLAQHGKQLPVLKHAPSGLGKFPTLTMPKQIGPSAGAVDSSAAALGKSTASMPTPSPIPTPSAPKTVGPMDSTIDYSPSRPGAYDPHSVISDPMHLDAADRASLAAGSRPSIGSYPNQSNATQLSPSKLITEPPAPTRSQPWWATSPSEINGYSAAQGQSGAFSHLM
jgi:hypothetical protein